MNNLTPTYGSIFTSAQIKIVTALRRFLFALSIPSQSSLREERFQTVINEFAGVISGIAFSYSTNENDLKDLRQDILINIWKGLESFRGDATLTTWIYRVALNTCVSTVRKREKNTPFIPIDSVTDIADETDSTLYENIELLHSLISSLSPLDKAIITMWLDERKYEEIAQVTGLSRSNVAVRVNRIKHRLAEKIDK